MESDKEILHKIVSERTDKIQSEALKNIEYIKENAEEELSRIAPDLMKQIKNFSVFKLLDVLDVIRDGGARARPFNPDSELNFDVTLFIEVVKDSPSIAWIKETNKRE